MDCHINQASNSHSAIMVENFEAAPAERKEINILKGLTILVVDDDKSNLALISYFLSRYGIQVMMADNASLAFELVQKSAVDLLISDIAMPEKSGYWLIGKVRSLQHLQTRKIPAIALTGEEKASEKVIASGFQSYIQKPSSPTELITEVTKLLSVKSNRFFLH